jgi:hypothetical protein
MAGATLRAAYNGRMKLSFSLAALLVAAAPAWSDEPPPSRVPEPKVQHTVIEDDGARIEELRVRGQTLSIVVTPKNGKAPAYEVVPANAARAPQSVTRGGLEGQRVWSVLSF